MKRIEPAEDYGFFGPDSITWKVWGYPTSLTVGFQRAVTIEELDPALIAAVDQTNAVRYRPRTRYDRTLRYFAMVAFGDSRSTSKAADVLVKVHSKGIGVEPLSGNRYDANDPHSQLWIHLTAWHSILYAYERYGPGKLSPSDEARYWQECAVAAELQTCSPDDVPLSREGIREYFARMRPRLAGSEAAQSMMAHLLDARVMLPPAPAVFKPATWIAGAVLRAGTIATMPQWMRRMGGLRQSRFADLAARLLLKSTFWLVHRSPRLELRLLAVLSPMTVPVVAPVLRGIRPVNPVVLTPAEARARYGYDAPAHAHLALRRKQASRVFTDGIAPSDEGIAESEPMLGSVR
ncbi:oxygenase MpaB family protein [Catelliglobosispora koreensis]|uniref:oxygenase MpaB family protein n=1 Tax=Catelliglobosispora koreensis TaxID=129052 RepID=UPI00035C9FE3|nr:oxygenase MpaB family protein [Catelliglobosispora koreensis]